MRKCRLTVIGTVYYQANDAVGEAVSNNWSAECADEQPYKRRVRLSPVFTRLDFGWVQGDCTVLIINNGKGVVELGFGDEVAGLYVPEGGDVRFNTLCPGRLFARGDGEVTLYAYAR